MPLSPAAAADSAAPACRPAERFVVHRAGHLAGRLDCRPDCGACCIAPSISTLGKPAGVACVHLTATLRCAIFGRPERPACCAGLQPSHEMCGDSARHALAWLAEMERLTQPEPAGSD